jgi:hypothetical protein
LTIDATLALTSPFRTYLGYQSRAVLAAQAEEAVSRWRNSGLPIVAGSQGFPQVAGRSTAA